MARPDGVRMARPLSECRLLHVEPQTGLAHLGIGPVATEAVAGQDGLHILVEVKTLCGLGCTGNCLLVVAADVGAQQRCGDTEGRRPGYKSELVAKPRTG